MCWTQVIVITWAGSGILQMKQGSMGLWGCRFRFEEAEIIPQTEPQTEHETQEQPEVQPEPQEESQEESQQTMKL